MWPPETFGNAVLCSLTFGAIGIVLTVLGYKVFDWLTPSLKLEHELGERQNIAVAIVVAAVIIGTAIIAAAVVS